MNILIADRQTLFSEGLQRIIREKYNQSNVKKVDSLDQLLGSLKYQVPEIIFLNAYFIDLHFDAIRPLLGKTRYPAIIAICDTNDTQLRQNAASVGAVTVLNKSTNSEEIWQVINDCHQQAIEERGMRLVKGNKSPSLLTKRQQSILQLISKGMTNKEVSCALNCAESTIKTHLNNIYRTLGVKSRTEALYAISKKSYGYRNVS